MRRAGRLGDGWIPSFTTPEEFRQGVEQVQRYARESRREVPADHFGALINYAFADSSEAALKLADPYIPRNRVDEATLAASTAFGPPEAVAQKIEEYMAGGGEVRSPPPLPARADARPANAAGRGGHFGLPQPLTRPVRRDRVPLYRGLRAGRLAGTMRWFSQYHACLVSSLTR